MVLPVSFGERNMMMRDLASGTKDIWPGDVLDVQSAFMLTRALNVFRQMAEKRHNCNKRRKQSITPRAITRPQKSKNSESKSRDIFGCVLLFVCSFCDIA